MDMHIIAYVYHWGEDILMQMKRSRRKKWVELILKQKEVEGKSIEEIPPVPK